jgi:hypothetical protein
MGVSAGGRGPTLTDWGLNAWSYTFELVRGGMGVGHMGHAYATGA